MLTRAAAWTTLATFVATIAFALVATARHATVQLTLEAVVFTVALSVFAYGSLVYFTTRRGYLRRRRAHVADRRDDLDVFAALGPRPASTLVLVPSYREDRRIVRQALLSIALQEYPGLRAVLLIDDPPIPTTGEERDLLTAARSLPAEVAAELEEPRARVAARLDELDVDGLREDAVAAELAALYTWSADWLDAKADAEHVHDHSDRFFVDAVLTERADRLRAAAARLARDGAARDELRTHARRLRSLFEVETASFERKRFSGLSHEPNKAMNLNAYLSLVGRRLDDLPEELAEALAETSADDVAVPDADYVATLDADSVLLPFYIARLVAALEAPGNEDVAVAQTPYSSIPGASTSLERVAGATTDLQYVIHQGFTAHEATYWVGANAVIRKRALDDIVVTTWEDGARIERYVHDRTVIEDTESSVDLAAAGWRLVNYPERLSYSATPPDFGALVVQRRRWANGGLIILPKCLRYSLSRRCHGIAEALLRIHYLFSIAASNIAFLVLLFCPLDERLGAPWLPFMCVPYIALFAHDLRLSGHRRRNVIDVSALNLVLLPVNLAGVAKSIQQAVLRRKTPFGRTPKVVGRTPTPAFYVIGVYGFIVLNAASFVVDAATGHWWHAGFALATVSLATYGALKFLGLRAAAGDLAFSLRGSERGQTAPIPSVAVEAE